MKTINANSNIWHVVKFIILAGSALGSPGFSLLKT